MHLKTNQKAVDMNIHIYCFLLGALAYKTPSSTRGKQNTLVYFFE